MAPTTNALIVHRVGNQAVHQRQGDGYVNATALCKAAGKLFGDYHRQKSTQRFMEELNAVMGIPITALVRINQGGRPELQGTWVHRQVAIHLASWLSVEFEVMVTKWVMEWAEHRDKIARYVSDEKREWEKTFPDELWRQFARLTGYTGPIHQRPKWWGKLVNKLIYDCIDRDMTEYLRATKPKPRKGQNYHQWITENGLKELNDHLQRVIGIAMTCHSMRELQETMERVYGDQFSLALVVADVPEMLWEGNAVH